MAIQDLIRRNEAHKKKGVCVFAVQLDFADLDTSGDTYMLANLPAEVVVTEVRVNVIEGFGVGAVANFGFDGDDSLGTGVDLSGTAPVDPKAVSLLKRTGGVFTLSPTFAQQPTAGKVVLIVEYVEYTKATGELTRF